MLPLFFLPTLLTPLLPPLLTTPLSQNTVLTHHTNTTARIITLTPHGEIQHAQTVPRIKKVYKTTVGWGTSSNVDGKEGGEWIYNVDTKETTYHQANSAQRETSSTKEDAINQFELFGNTTITRNQDGTHHATNTQWKKREIDVLLQRPIKLIVQIYPNQKERLNTNRMLIFQTKTTLIAIDFHTHQTIWKVKRRIKNDPKLFQIQERNFVVFDDEIHEFDHLDGTTKQVRSCPNQIVILDKGAICYDSNTQRTKVIAGQVSTTTFFWTKDVSNTIRGFEYVSDTEPCAQLWDFTVKNEHIHQIMHPSHEEQIFSSVITKEDGSLLHKDLSPRLQIFTSVATATSETEYSSAVYVIDAQTGNVVLSSRYACPASDLVGWVGEHGGGYGYLQEGRPMLRRWSATRDAYGFPKVDESVIFLREQLIDATMTVTRRGISPRVMLSDGFLYDPDRLGAYSRQVTPQAGSGAYEPGFTTSWTFPTGLESTSLYISLGSSLVTNTVVPSRRSFDKLEGDQRAIILISMIVLSVGCLWAGHKRKQKRILDAWL